MSSIKTIKFTLIFTLVAFCGLMLDARQGYAISLDLNKIKPLTPIELMPQADFEKATKLIEEEPHEDPFLAYKVRLPKDWTESKDVVSKDIRTMRYLKDNAPKSGTNVSQRVLGDLVRYMSPPKNYVYSFFKVEALQLDYNVGARNWFVNYVLSNGLSLDQVGTESEKQVEALYVKVEGDITYIVRVKAILNGPRIIVASYSVPQEHYDSQRLMQAQVINSFELLNREEVGAEALKVYGFLSESYFDYPVSWTLQASDVSSMESMKASLYYNSAQNKLGGKINIFLTNKLANSKRSDVLKSYIDKLMIDSHELGGLIEKPSMEYHPDMSFGVTQVYRMNSKYGNMVNYELWVSVLESEDYIYVMGLLTPSRTEEFYTWARNIEAYRIVLKSMRRHDDSVNSFQFY